MEDMKYELKFLEMFDLSLSQITSNVWQVTDASGKEVGFIKYKKIISKNNKKNTPAVFGYVTEIETDKIAFRKQRSIGDCYDPSTPNNESTSYELTLKNGEDLEHAEINAGKNPSVAIWSSEHGHMDFRISFDELYLNFKSKTEKHNLDETVILKWDQDTKSDQGYFYGITFCDKNKRLTDSRGVRSLQIEGIYNVYNESPLTINEMNWKDGKLTTNKKSKSTATIEDMVVGHEMGINALNHFFYLVENMMPAESFVESLLEELPFYNNSLKHFISSSAPDNGLKNN